jgi:hypothetical protein
VSRVHREDAHLQRAYAPELLSGRGVERREVPVEHDEEAAVVPLGTHLLS